MSSGNKPRRMGGPGRGMAPGEKAKDFKGTFKKIVAYIGNYKLRTVVCQYQSNINSEKMF